MRKKLVKDLLVLAVFFTGLGVFAYPFVASAVNHLALQQQLKRDAATAKTNAAKRKAAAKKQNALLAANGIRPITPDFGTSKSATTKLLKQHVLGAVTIPAINVSIPLFDTTTEALLQQGATVLPNTSFPTGGKDHHTVISAHSGLPTKTFFTDLDQVKRGDRFILTVGGKHMAYKVDRIRTILPQQVDALKMEAGRDLATLMTCVPYGVNSHRLLVTGHRVPYTESLDEAAKAATDKRTWWSWALIAAAVAAGIALIGLVVKAVKNTRKGVERE